MKSKDTEHWVRLPIPLEGEDCVFIGVRLQGKDYGYFYKIDADTIDKEKLDYAFSRMSDSAMITIANRGLTKDTGAIEK